ncbi:MAG: hypothetical protein H0V82_09465 [Candidatus Protochlamydia sp.]|nr:hypothetical protein [Candidatus Protochlamydia sp.]
MKKQHYFTFLMAAFAISANLHSHGMESQTKKAAQHSPYYGPTEINGKTMESLVVFGPAKINNSNITQTATLKGPVDAEHSTFNILHVDGIAKFHDVKANMFSINGPVIANDSKLDEISIASNELTLSNTAVNRLTVRINNYTPDKQTVYLEKGSKIGTLIFESKKGVVVMEDSTSKVEHLEGGSIRHNNQQATNR